MKKTLLSLLAVLAAAVTMEAQKFEPTISWPYILKDFTTGEILNFRGEQFKAADLNVCVSDGSLHYIDKGMIMKADMSNVGSARIGTSIYLNKAGKLYKVEAMSEKGCVLVDNYVDSEQFGKVNIGYGISSATASSQNISILTDAGSDMVNKRLSTAKEMAGEGVALPMRQKYYIVAEGTLVPAVKREVLAAWPASKDKISKFIKENKTEWKNADSLLKLADFISAL